jgi:hypothetical protein
MNEVPVRLLRETLQDRVPAGPSDECLDAGTVAAWADDTLGRDERRAAEAHTADCVRCQALVAAMVRTAPPTAAARSWWRGPVMGWLAPLTAVAAALLVWMNLPRTAIVPPTTAVLREVKQEPRPAQNALANVRPASDQDNANQDNPRREPPRQGNPRQENTAAAPARQGTAKVNSEPKPGAALDGAQSSAVDKFRSEVPAPLAKGFSLAAGEAAAPAASPAPAAPPPPAAAAASPPPPLAATDSLTTAPPSPTVRRTTAAAESVNARALLLEARRPPAPIVSSNASSQWRILANGAVQHSTDSGSTWAVQQTGVSAMLTAGASPAPAICWLVGPEGIVLLSTDGRSWRRVAFPETVDLAAVRATDDKSATVITSDGRAFTTTDGGQTWTRSPG